MRSDLQIELSDLLHITLHELDYQYGSPIRAHRSADKPITIKQFIDDIVNIDSVAILLGEAGVGKTTTCKYLCYFLAKENSNNSAIPIYIPLGEYDTSKDFQSILVDQGRNITIRELADTVKSTNRRLIIFLDGLNEQIPVILIPIIAQIQKLILCQKASVVLTSRPVIAAVDTIWPGQNPRFFEIRRWTSEQLSNYFKKNRCEDKLKRIPHEVRDCLRLPLLASHVIRRLNSDEPFPSMLTVNDVFAYILNQFMKNNKGRNLSCKPEKKIGTNYKRYLQELAYRMTEKKIIQTEGLMLEEILLGSKKGQLFKPLLAYTINSGLLRSSNAVVAVDPNAELDELRALKISFIHQAFQEYLTAQQLLSNPSFNLPQDVSHDAFWREVPIYIIQSYAKSTEKQEIFVRKFLNSGEHDSELDFFTSARLANKISNPRVRENLEKEIIEKLLINIKKARLYPYAIDTFAVLGPRGLIDLRNCLQDTSSFSRIFAKAEAHLIGRPTKDANDPEWRRLGRSVYILGELEDFWLMHHVHDKLNIICSLHLLYHIGEAILKLARIPNLTLEQKNSINAIGTELANLSLIDPVMQGYAYAITRTCNEKADNQINIAAELKRFLLEKRMNTERQDFLDEFWQRAHGVEVFSEVAEPDKCIYVLEELFTAEDKADYTKYEINGYNEVQSCIMKALLRLRNMSQVSTKELQQLLVYVFRSNRIAENRWACRHLEHFLINWINNSRENLQWIKERKENDKLGGASIYNVLSNIIWLFG